MKIKLLACLIIVSIVGCKHKDASTKNIITTDISNFWNAYDHIITTQDSVLQYQYLDSLYFQKGTLGLKGIMQARNYTSDDYINAINRYPKFWTSVRENTLKTDQYVSELAEGIEKMKAIYPALKPAKIYFTIGALRSNGTTMDSLVLIGSELAMADQNTVASEFEERSSAQRRIFFDSNPIDNLVLLNIHEYVHTQQKPVVNNLLSYVLHEGIAEFVSVKALNVPSATPAISYGKKNDAVKIKFEKSMFNGNNVYQWLWSDSDNEFNMRDLGYYIGYQISEINYNQADDKQAAIKEMIELDYTNEAQIEDFVNRSHFFSKSLEELYTEFEKSRPTVLKIKQFENENTTVNPNIKELTFEFSEPLNGQNTGVDYGVLGKDYFPPMDSERVWSNDNKSWTVKVHLEPNTHYQFLISNNFRTQEGIPLKPYMVEFRTSD